jgi:hypothetical protein
LSAEQDKVRSIAERVASRLGGGDSRGAHEAHERNGANGDDVTQLRDALREMQQRLAQIESRVGRNDAGAQREPVKIAQSQTHGESQARAQLLSSTYVPATHPSQERFGIDDAVTELVDFFEKEKVCSVEPGGKPCDHCAMCSTRGF